MKARSMHSISVRSGNDLFGVPILSFLFKNRIALISYRLLTLFLLVSALIYGFVRPSPEENPFTTAVFWSLFWPFFMVITLPTLGNVFCMICPLGFVGRHLQKAGPGRRIPKFLKNPYLGLILFNILGYWFMLYTFPGIWRNPLNTAVFFSIILVISLIVFYLFRGMAFCKYLCPIGSVNSAFARVGFTWLSTYREECSGCRKPDCALSCPYELNPSRFDERNSMANCTLCMECAHACDAVRFEVRGWSSSLLNRIPRPEKWEVWSYILLVGVITFGMRFHHGLGRTQLADYTPWHITGSFLQSYLGIPKWIDVAGLTAMLMALGTVLGVVYVSTTLASRISGMSREKVFLEIGYAFAPLMIVGSLSHVLEFFFLHYYSDAVNGISHFLGLNLRVEPLAHRGDWWLNLFKVFPLIGGLWSLYILHRRVNLLNPPSKGRFYSVSALLPFLYLFLWAFTTAAGFLFPGGHTH